jgi:hypothetical protein
MKVDGGDNDDGTPPMMMLKCADCEGEHDNDEKYANTNSVGIRRRRRREGNVLVIIKR